MNWLPQGNAEWVMLCLGFMLGCMFTLLVTAA